MSVWYNDDRSSIKQVDTKEICYCKKKCVFCSFNHQMLHFLVALWRHLMQGNGMDWHFDYKYWTKISGYCKCRKMKGSTGLWHCLLFVHVHKSTEIIGFFPCWRLNEYIWLPTLFSSNTLKTKEANLVGSPKGKNCLYIFWKPTASSCPLGQSLMKPLYLRKQAQRQRLFQRERKRLAQNTKVTLYGNQASKRYRFTLRALIKKAECRAICLTRR